jgi:hypothetical protein
VVNVTFNTSKNFTKHDPRQKKATLLACGTDYYSHREKLLPLYLYAQKINFVEFCYKHTKATNKAPRFSLAIHGNMYASTTTLPPAAAALPQLCCAPRLLITRPHGLCLNLVMHRDYSSPGCTGSTSTSPCAASTRLPAAAALHRLCRAPPWHHL